MQCALRNILRTENGREKRNNKLISLLFENITTLAQLHHFTRAERTTEETSHNSIGHGTQVPPEIRATVKSSVMDTCHFTRTDSRGGVSCMAVIPIDLNRNRLFFWKKPKLENEKKRHENHQSEKREEKQSKRRRKIRTDQNEKNGKKEMKMKQTRKMRNLR